MFVHLLESSHRDDSNTWSNIRFGKDILQVVTIEVNFTHFIWSSGVSVPQKSYFGVCPQTNIFHLCQLWGHISAWNIRLSGNGYVVILALIVWHRFVCRTYLILNKWRWFDYPEANDAIEEWKLQSGFDSDCSLTVIKGATLSTPLASA